MERKQLTAQQTEALRAPLPNEAIKQHPTKTYLHTVNPIYVVDRLNEVFGIGGWTIRHEVIERDKMIVVHATFQADEYGIRLEQFGGNDNPDRGDAYKGACTDALTKIGSYMGIGADVWKDKYKNGGQPQAQPKASPQAPAQPAFVPQELHEKIVGAPTGTTREQFAKLYTQHIKQPYSGAMSQLIADELEKRGLKKQTKS